MSAPMVAFVIFSQIAVSAFSSSVSNKIIFNTTLTYSFLKLYPLWYLELRFLSLHYSLQLCMKKIIVLLGSATVSHPRDVNVTAVQPLKTLLNIIV